jgi:hypothetical protein
MEYERGFKRGVEAAGDYNSSTTHPFQDPKQALIHGFALALSEVAQRSSSSSEVIVNAAHGFGLTIAMVRKAGTDPYDLKFLRRAGVPRG